MEIIDGAVWSFVVDGEYRGHGQFYHVDPFADLDGKMMHLCSTYDRARLEVRSQYVQLDPGRRPGHVLWRERAERRINQLDDGEVIPWNLVRES